MIQIELVGVSNFTATRIATDHQRTINGPGSGEDLARFIAAESARWGRVIRDRKISTE